MGTFDKECEGCISHIDTNNDSRCSLPHKINNLQCPCIECILICMCTNSNGDCEKFAEFDKMVCDKEIKQRIKAARVKYQCHA